MLKPAWTTYRAVSKASGSNGNAPLDPMSAPAASGIRGQRRKTANVGNDGPCVRHLKGHPTIYVSD